MSQPSLFAQRTRIEREFAEFDAANPEVWKLFVRFAFEVMQRGKRRYSADAILHRIRWFEEIETVGGRGFKVNDDFTAHYARKFIRTFPEHGDFFETRRRREVAT